MENEKRATGHKRRLFLYFVQMQLPRVSAFFDKISECGGNALPSQNLHEALLIS
jgi:hypothetical protein